MNSSKWSFSNVPSKTAPGATFAKEELELKLIQTLLPQALSETEVEQLIQAAIQKVDAKGPKDMGLIMKEIKRLAKVAPVLEKINS